jgi:hypothetical protein
MDPRTTGSYETSETVLKIRTGERGMIRINKM